MGWEDGWVSTSRAFDGDDAGADVDFDAFWDDQLLLGEDVFHLEQWCGRLCLCGRGLSSRRCSAVVLVTADQNAQCGKIGAKICSLTSALMTTQGYGIRSWKPKLYAVELGT